MTPSFINKTFLRTITMYLGSAWVFIEASSYFIERFNYPDHYKDIIMILLAFGLLAIMINEWNTHRVKKYRSTSFVVGVYGTNILLAILVSYSYHDYSLKNEIQFDRVKNERVSIAVLPFENIKADKSSEWLSDGLSNEIIDELNLINSVDVKSRSASFYFKGKDFNPVQIANLLGVNTLLEGTVLKIDSILKISIKLVNPHTGSQIWNESFERPYKDLLDVQSEIASKVAEKINADITKRERAKIDRSPTNNIEAFEAYMKGKYHYNLFTVADNKRAHDYFEKALSLDPNLAEAYVYLGLTYNLFGGIYLGLPSDSAYQIVENYADKALTINPELALGYFLKANVTYFYERNYKEGLKIAQKAFNMADTKEDMIWFYCMMLAINKKADEAMKILTEYIEDNPTSSQAYNALCNTKLIRDGKNPNVPLEEFYEPCNKGMELDPTNLYNKYYLAELLFIRKDYKQAIKYFEELVSITPAPHLIEALFRSNYYLGDTARAMQYFNQLKMIANQQNIPFYMAKVHATLGNNREMGEFLEEAYQLNEIEIVQIWFDPAFDTVRNEPEFQRIISRLKYAGDAGS